MDFGLPKPIEGITDKLPDFIKNDTEKNVFDAVSQRIKNIESIIKDGSTPVKKRDLKIAKSAICKSLELSPSYINKNPELNEWVDSEQRRLNRVAKGSADKIKIVLANQKSIHQMKRDELILEITRLKKELNERRSEIYTEQLNRLMDAGLTQSQSATESIINRLQKENNELSERNALLSRNLTQLQKDILAIQRENIKMKGPTSPQFNLIKKDK